MEQRFDVDVSFEADDLLYLRLELGFADSSVNGALNALRVGIRKGGGKGAIDEPLRLCRIELGGGASGYLSLFTHFFVSGIKVAAEYRS